MPRKLQITYSSDLTIKDPELLATLSVFYDKIYLPYPYNCDPDAEPLIGMLNIFTREALLKDPEVWEYVSWRSEYRALFDSGILECVPPAVIRHSPTWTDEQEEEVMAALGAAARVADRENSSSEEWGIRSLIARTIHASFTKKPCAEFFSGSSTAALAGLIARPLFRYRLPRLAALTGEQILEIRGRVKDTREGFIDYIFELTDDLESRIRDDASHSTEAADKLVERKIVPKYEEYCRQLDGNNTKFGAKLFAIGAGVMQIDASPLTPKFYGQIFEILLKAFGDVATVEAKHKTNAGQAFQYLSKLEGSSR